MDIPTQAQLPRGHAVKGRGGLLLLLFAGTGRVCVREALSHARNKRILRTSCHHRRFPLGRNILYQMFGVGYKLNTLSISVTIFQTENRIFLPSLTVSKRILEFCCRVLREYNWRWYIPPSTCLYSTNTSKYVSRCVCRYEVGTQKTRDVLIHLRLRNCCSLDGGPALAASASLL